MTPCKDFYEKLSLFIDNETTDDEKQNIEKHLEECVQCKEQYLLLKDVIEQIQDIPLVPLPEGLHEEAMEKIRKLNFKSKFAARKIYFRRYANIAAVILILLVGASGLPIIFDSNKSSESQAQSISTDTGFTAAENAAMESDIFLRGTTASSVSSDNLMMIINPNEKVDRNYSIIIKTDNFLQTIQAINGLSGYNTSSQINYQDNSKQNGRAFILRRVSEQSYENTKTVLRDLGEIIDETESETQMTLENYDLKAKINVKEEEIQRLNALIRKSSTMENIIFIEQRLSDISYELDNLKGRSLYITNESEMPNINITIISNEKGAVSSQSLAQKIKTGYQTSTQYLIMIFKELLVFISMIFLPAIAFVSLGLIISFIMKKIQQKGGIKK